jgi:hypothetical protein
MGLLSSSMGGPRPERGGRARRQVKPTARGLMAVRESRRVKVDLLIAALPPDGGQSKRQPRVLAIDPAQDLKSE